ncbi:hypothetical protein BDV11DRAFT_197767 [Aspergillus similis]
MCPQPSISGAVAHMASHMTVDKASTVESCPGCPGCPGFWGFLGFTPHPITALSPPPLLVRRPNKNLGRLLEVVPHHLTHGSFTSIQSLSPTVKPSQCSLRKRQVSRRRRQERPIPTRPGGAHLTKRVAMTSFSGRFFFYLNNATFVVPNGFRNAYANGAVNDSMRLFLVESNLFLRRGNIVVHRPVTCQSRGT